MSRSKPDYGAVKSELSDSLFFQRKSPQAAEQEGELQAILESSDHAASAHGVESLQTERANGRTGERASNRSIVRQSYEIYRDQHAALKKFSLEEQTRGEKGSMSEMVREAIDAYIAKRLRQRSRAPAN